MVIITMGLGLLVVVSGMLGLGVAFAAIPFLGLFLPDLVHQVSARIKQLFGVLIVVMTLYKIWTLLR